MFDIDGFLTSTEFLIQLASLITALLSSLVGDLIAGFFAAS